MTTEQASPDTLSANHLFHQLDAYPWSSDPEFQGGLKAILGSVQDPAQIEHLTLRAKCYYYARKTSSTVDFDGYRAWVEEGNGGDELNGGNELSQVPVDDDIVVDLSANGDGGIASAPKPASFAEICDMIAEGKPIPGIKEIPDTVLEGQASEKSVGGRRKPWEEKKVGVGGEAGKASWMT